MMAGSIKKWFDELIASDCKQPFPILSFPAVELMGITVRELLSDSGNQARAMSLVAQKVPSAAAVSFMDLSVEAEAFGADIRFSEDEIPTVTGRIITEYEDAEALAVPAVGNGRSGVCIEAVSAAAATITDRPVFAGVIGPFSLAGRLMDVSEALPNCIEEPEMVHLTLEKTTRFIIQYIRAFKDTGCAGVLMAEPLAGLLPAAMAAEFSCTYVKQIISAVQDDGFAVIYHNCGSTVAQYANELADMGAAAYHFGNAADMEEMLRKMPETVPVMGNVDPASVIFGGNPETVREATLSLLRRCGRYQNFILSSGCDIPPRSPWENISAFFDAAAEYYTILG